MVFDTIKKYNLDIILLALIMFIILIFSTIFGSKTNIIQQEISSNLETKEVHDKLVISSFNS